MKKKTLKTFSLFIGMGLIGYTLSVAYVEYENAQRIQKTMNLLPHENMSPLGVQAYKVITEKGCQYCHSQENDLPFYSHFPIAKKWMEQNRHQGLQHFQLDPMLAAMRQESPISEVDLAKLEWAIKNRTMPPKSHLKLHWKGSLNNKERKTLLTWISKNRKKQHKNSPASKPFKNEPIQPIYSHFSSDPKKRALGQSLFHDIRLSSNNTLSCASCHSLTRGGVDGLNAPKGAESAQGSINTPTVFNAVFNTHQFWDGRAEHLQAQAAIPPVDPLKMASPSWKAILDKLEKDAALKDQFLALYPEGITKNSVTDAIAEFERSLTTPNSRFDLFLKGNKIALTEQEKRGYSLFKKHKCDTCHTGEAIGGRSFEVMGLKRDYFKDRGNVTDIDKGRFNVTQNPIDLHRFKVPTLRNIALTAPYFHDAHAQTLEQAVALMGAYQIGVDFSADEIQKITAYLKTLTGEYKGTTLSPSG